MGHETNKQQAELDEISGRLITEFLERFSAWNAEYASQERDLGKIGEAVNFWRKAKRVKAVIIDGVSDKGWREGLRTVLFEVIGHAFLLIFDLDREAAVQKPKDDGMVPGCGYVRCVAHPEIELDKLDLQARAVYDNELRRARKGIAPLEMEQLMATGMH